MDDDALKLWELENNVKLVDSERDVLYGYDESAHKTLQADKPWSRDPRYFRRVQISAVALMKMVMHAREGGRLEVMGVMQGYVQADAFIITDAYRLPVEGTETRVNAHEEANEYLVNYLELCRQQGGRTENAVGWYHSHPGYGCWLSGIDVRTQQQQQQFLDPFVAVVIDPDRTVNAGKVEIGAFRTFTEEPHQASATAVDRPRAVPAEKAADFGAYANHYYPLQLSHFRSTLDARLLEQLWHKYWIQTLSQNPLLASREYSAQRLRDLSVDVSDAAGLVGGSGSHATVGGGGGGGGARPPDMHSSGTPAVPVWQTRANASEEAVSRAAEVSNLVAARERRGLIAGQVKSLIFGRGALTREQSQRLAE